ncbi:FecR family protein [Devosia sp. LjRoot16]|uniref:FecR family protein n=1 Tax=Devosia sp. LjRoot16 TaxID=3342271 RepID=UPI003ECE5925
MGVDPAAAVETKADTKTLTVGADIFIGDRVVTGAKGQVQIKFSDQTELVVGPNSALLIEDYLLRQDDSAGKFAINALSGTFRFTTGRAPKDRYIIETPTGTIGVRGTSFDFNSSTQETKVLLYHGQVVLCNLSNTCVTLDDTCELGAYDLGKSEILGDTDDFKGAARDDLKANFKYAQSQAPLLGAFRVEEAKECFQKGFAANTPQSLIYGEGGDPSPDLGEEPPPEECQFDVCN